MTSPSDREESDSLGRISVPADRYSQVQTTARYAHLANDPVKAAAGKVSDYVGAAMITK